MNSILRYTIFVAFCCLFIIQVAAAQDKSPHTQPDKTSKPITPPLTKESEIEFPDVDGWEKIGIRKYPTAELGYSVGYQSEEGGTVTVYVYNAGLKNIPSDITGKTVKSEIERAKNDIHQLGKADYYQDVKELKNDTVTLGGTAGKVKALHSLFSFKAKGQALTSEIYLFGYQNNFIKIRASRSKDAGETANKALAKLLAEIDTLFSK